MSNKNTQNNDFFEKMGLELSSTNVEIGKTYWIYGCITKFLDETPEHVVAEINFSIHANITVQDSEKVELLKERAFDTGIFVCTVTSVGEKIEADCQTVVFGKKQSLLV